MANLSLFGLAFTELDGDVQLTLIKNARNLRRQKLPEVVRKKKVAKPKTTTKKQRLTQQLMFNSIAKTDQVALIEALLAKKKGED